MMLRLMFLLLVVISPVLADQDDELDQIERQINELKAKLQSEKEKTIAKVESLKQELSKTPERYPFAEAELAIMRRHLGNIPEFASHLEELQQAVAAAKVKTEQEGKTPVTELTQEELEQKLNELPEEQKTQVTALIEAKKKEQQQAEEQSLGGQAKRAALYIFFPYDDPIFLLSLLFAILIIFVWLVPLEFKRGGTS